MTPLRQRMLNAMVLRGFAVRTQESYIDAIYGLAKHYRGDPTQYSAQEIEAYTCQGCLAARPSGRGVACAVCASGVHLATQLERFVWRTPALGD